jgi:hypothetical protein
MQGGIATKTYWLYRGLKERGYQFRIVTCRDDNYLTPDCSLDHSEICVVSQRAIPWHIPESTLTDDRILNSSIQWTKEFKPDIVETNYLWPFCKNAILLALYLKTPLIIRHAGSDILKFKNDPEFMNIIRWYFHCASAVVTNHDSFDLVSYVTDNAKKLKCLPRYVPNPNIFNQSGSSKQYDLLFAGKINYHWNLKGLCLLLDVIKKKSLYARFIMGGKYEAELNDLISDYQIKSQIDVSNFVTPEQMPDIYKSSRFVWCWEERGSLHDFSNVVWESIFSGIPCIMNVETSKNVEAEGLIGNFSKLIYRFDSKSLMDFDFIHKDDKVSIDWDQKLNMYERYILSNKDLYKAFSPDT